ncbi:MAG: tail fiber domain-containing protein [Alphaproteobacteria bacterium]|nr:MAG: tail fiber domain-containing protein [Alphaproteobacteria bacterium]
MRKTHSITSQSGFTLVELAIVLAIAGLLFAGIWGLIASGQQQLRAKQEADNIRQIIEATRTFLAGAANPSTPGGSWARTPSLLAPGAVREIVIGPATGSIPDRTLIGGGFLPNSPGGATNVFPYSGGYTGQRYRVVAQRLQTSPALLPTDNATFRWRFMVVTQPDPVVPVADRELIEDKQGGTISAMLGSEGGFMYSQPFGQCLANRACGTGAAWIEDVTSNWSPLAFNAGHMAARVQMSPDIDTSSPWLARLNIGIPEYNRMFTTLDMNNNNLSNIKEVTQNDGSGFSLSIRGGALQTVNANTTSDFSGGAWKFFRGAGDTLAVISVSDADPLNPDVTNPVFNVAGAGTATRWTAVEFIYNSDARLKTDIKPIEGALDKLLQIRGDTFNWKKDGKPGVGLIAQDVEKVFPELVTTTGKDGMKGVQYGNLVAPIIEALRQIKEENDALRARLEKLEAPAAQ